MKIDFEKLADYIEHRNDLSSTFIGQTSSFAFAKRKLLAALSLTSSPWCPLLEVSCSSYQSPQRLSLGTSIPLPLSSISSILLPIAVKTSVAAQVSCPTPNPGLGAPRCHGAPRLPLTGPHLPVGVHSLWWQHREGVASHVLLCDSSDCRRMENTKMETRIRMNREGDAVRFDKSALLLPLWYKYSCTHGALKSGTMKTLKS